MVTRKIWDRALQSKYSLMRIPGILLTSGGDIIIYNEARRSTEDWAHMDILARISHDGGESFSAPIALAYGTQSHPTVNNPVMAEDANGTLHFLCCEDYGTNGGRILHRTSADGGESWGECEDITPATLPEYRNVFALGPGHGICTACGALAFPFWLVPKRFGHPERAHVPSEVGMLYSRDGGKTWGASPLLSAREDIVSPNETVAAELPSGELYLAIRQNAPARAYAVLKSDFSAFSKYAPVDGICDPICFGSVVSDEKDLIFVNCDHSKKRRNLTLRISCDSGKTWQKSFVVDSERGGYADVAADPIRKKIYVLYENDFGRELFFSVIDKSEIK